MTPPLMELWGWKEINGFKRYLGDCRERERRNPDATQVSDLDMVILYMSLKIYKLIILVAVPTNGSQSVITCAKNITDYLGSLRVQEGTVVRICALC